MPNAVVDVDSVDLYLSLDYTIFGCPKMLNIVNFAGTGDRSEYDIESY